MYVIRLSTRLILAKVLSRERRSAGFYPTHVLHMYVLYQTSHVCMYVTCLRSHLILAKILSREGPCAGFYPTHVLHMYVQEPHTKFHVLSCFTRGLIKEIEEFRRSLQGFLHHLIVC